MARVYSNTVWLFCNDKGRQVEKLGPVPYGYAQAWSPDGLKLAVAYDISNEVHGLGIYNFVSKQLELVVPMSQGHISISSAAWLPDSRMLIWDSGDGICKTDTETKRTVKLKSSCNSRMYIYPTVSPDGRTILVQRTGVSIIDNNSTIQEESSLWAMDIDGNNERKVKS